MFERVVVLTIGLCESERDGMVFNSCWAWMLTTHINPSCVRGSHGCASKNVCCWKVSKCVDAGQVMCQMWVVCKKVLRKSNGIGHNAIAHFLTLTPGVSQQQYVPCHTMCLSFMCMAGATVNGSSKWLLRLSCQHLHHSVPLLVKTPTTVPPQITTRSRHGFIKRKDDSWHHKMTSSSNQSFSTVSF